MKFKTLSLFAIIGITFYTLSLSSSSGPTTSQGDCTGSPLSTQTCNTSGCHNNPIISNADPFRPFFNPRNIYMAIQNNYVKALDTGWDAITHYQPGHTYILNMTPDFDEILDLNSNTVVPTLGLQATALLSNNSQAGNFSILDTNLQLVTISGIEYVEHKHFLISIRDFGGSPGDLSTLSHFFPATITWTAPPAGSGDVTIYCAALGCNNDNNSAGDSVITRTLVIHEDTTTATTQIKTIPQVQTYPNPTVDVVNITFGVAADYTIRTTDLSGKTLQNKTFTNATRATINLADYPKGTYILYINDGERTSTQKIMKQ